MPPDGEAWRVLVDKARKVVGEVLFKNGHIERDWVNSASMMVLDNESQGQCNFVRQSREPIQSTVRETMRTV